jgi:hypothetical protein
VPGAVATINRRASTPTAALVVAGGIVAIAVGA